MSFIEMMNRIDRDHEVAHERLRSICGQSGKLNYEDMIKRLKELTGDIAGYKFDFFVNMLANEMENNKRLNIEDWDMTEDQIVGKYNDDIDYWERMYDLYGDKDYCKSVMEFKENMMDWIVEYSLTGAFASVEAEYKYRKNEGLIG